jgi:hypothetical protein
MTVAGSTLWYYNGAQWIEETSKLRVTVEDSLAGRARLLTAEIADPKNLKNAVYTPYVKIILAEKRSGDNVFSGRLESSDSTYSPETGRSIKITVKDYAQAFFDRIIDTDYSGTPRSRSALIAQIIADYAFPGTLTTNIEASGSTRTVKMNYNKSGKTVLQAISALAEEDPWDNTPTGYGYDFIVDDDQVFQYFKRGSKAANLTVAYGASTTANTKAMLPNYSFSEEPREIITRVTVRGNDNTGSLVTATAIDRTLESAYSVIKQKFDYVYGSNMTSSEMFVVCTDRANALLKQDQVVLTRGVCQVVGYPTYGASNAVVRVGELVHVQLPPQNISSDYLLIGVKYEEMPGLATLEMISSVTGKSYSKYTLDSVLKSLHEGEDVSLNSAKIGDLVVGTAQIGDASITNAKIANLAVDAAKIANLAVEEGKIANLAVSNGKIAALAVDSAKIANLAVGTSQLANQAVTSGKIYALSVSSAHISDCAIDKLLAGTLGVTGTLGVGGKFITGLAGTNRIEISQGEIAGYNSSNVKQFYLDASTGKAFAGAGAVILDSGGLSAGNSAIVLNVDGCQIYGQTLKFYNGVTNISIEGATTTAHYILSNKDFTVLTSVPYSTNIFGGSQLLLQGDSVNINGNAICSSLSPRQTGAYNLGSSSYYFNYGFINYINCTSLAAAGTISGNAISTSVGSYVYDLYPNAVNGWLGSATSKWAVVYTAQLGNATNKVTVYCDGLSACPLPAVTDAVGLFRKLQQPSLNSNGHFGPGKYYAIDTFPDECKTTFIDRKKDGTQEIKTDIELIRTIGICFRAIHQLTDQIDAINTKLGITP